MKKVKVKIGNITLLISAFCFQKVGDTENMKFRVECKTNPELSGVFDDFVSVKNHLGSILEDQVFDMILEM